MKRILLCATLLLAACGAPSKNTSATVPAAVPALDAGVTGESDPNLWLEDVGSDKALDWVRQQNVFTKTLIEGDRGFATLKSDLLTILNSDEKIPHPKKRGKFYYNFWQDRNHVRGVLRRTTPVEYKKVKPQWETVLDIDALNTQENQSWVYKGSQCLPPARERCLLTLSRGGADAAVVREFDTVTRSFVKDGFLLPEAKSRVQWIDKDRVYVGTDFGAGSLTDSGYPRMVKEWKRGTALGDATVVYEGQTSDMEADAFHDYTKGFERDFVTRTVSFFADELFWRKSDGTLVKVEKPNSAIAEVWREYLTLQLRDPWEVKTDKGNKVFPAGALLATRFDEFMAGKRAFSVLFQPTEHRSLAGVSTTQHAVILTVLEDVKSRVQVLKPGVPGAQGWTEIPFVGAPSIGSVEVSAVDADESDEFWMTSSDFLTPTKLSLGTLGNAPTVLKQEPVFFDAKELAVAQYFAVSKDGTRIPYFVVGKQTSTPGGKTKTLLYGYGGFEVSETPSYSGTLGRAWLAEGGTYVVANIRGGGEYGPKWHQAALRENRLRAYEDFAAVAEDLIARKIASPKQLGIFGGSNGGLLVGNMAMLYPQLFGAVVCKVPLLDMRRYNKLLAGASWVEEYGDPDKPEEWAFIQKFSPYHLVKPQLHYPPMLFTTSTRDDRVHPSHARKMYARMKEQGHAVWLYENIEGGHGGSADREQAAYLMAAEYTFLAKKLSE
jgi:prolyl oligopeptidase